MRIRNLTVRCLPVPLMLVLAGCAHTTDVRMGQAALEGWQVDGPGVKRFIKPADLPPAPDVQPANAEKSIAHNANVVPRPEGALPKVPEGFAVEIFATGLKRPRTMRIAPNGDVFLSEVDAGRVLVFRPDAGGRAGTPEVFAEGLDRPYGIAFVPAAAPRWVYVAAADRVVRYPYRTGDARAMGPAEVIIGGIPTKRHWTRDLALAPDGNHLFVSIGSSSNLGIMPEMTPEQMRQNDATHGRGASWGDEENRAVVRMFDLDGRNVRNYATGLRNCSGMTVQPATGKLWCIVNERDHLGDNLVPDYLTRVNDGDFFGWPWYYIGDHEDPVLRGKRPDLKGGVRTPDVLLQSHSAALSVVFYDGDAFPAEYRGDAFAALHGSHSTVVRTGYKVIRVRMKNGQPTGEYDDFMTGFLVDNDNTWGRPAGVAVARDGALLVSEDVNGTVYRVTRK